MRKTILAALLGTAILAGCAKETMLESSEQETKTAQPISVDITVASPGDEVDTKAAKTNWATGDRINIWYDANIDQSVPDLVIKYNGSIWAVDSKATVSGNTPSASGTLRALYLSDNSDLSGFTTTYYENAKYPQMTGMKYYLPTAYDEKSPRTPMITGAVNCSYTCSGNTLTSTLKGWTFITPLKVLITAADGELSGDISSYTLEVKNTTTNKTAAVKINFLVRTNYFSNGENSAITATGAVRESDGIAFYFGDFTVAETDTVTFTFYDNNKKETRTRTKTGHVLSTSSSSCTGIVLNFSSFILSVSDPWGDNKEIEC